MRAGKEQSKIFSQVEDYVEDRLDKEEILAFEQEIERNAALGDAVENYFRNSVPQGNNATDALAEEHWKNTIKSNSVKILSLSNQNKWLLLAASILGIIGIIYFLTQNKTPSNDNLYAEYFEMPRLEGLVMRQAVRSGEKNDGSYLEWNNVLDSYEKEDYSTALQSLNSISKTTMIRERMYSEYLCLKGILLLHDKQYQTAYDILTLEETSNPTQKEWYAALALLKLDRSKEELINTFSNFSNSYNTQRGQPILKMLSKN